MPDWAAKPCIIAASGPSLTPAVAEQCRQAYQAGTHNVAVVNDAYRLVPFADLLYACDQSWWNVHKGCPNFAGEKWSSQHHRLERGQPVNEKKALAQKYGLKLIHGRHADGFSFEPGIIHYGSNSGFQLLNLILLFGATEIIMVGYDMRHVNGKRHFFGNHPQPLNNSANYEQWAPIFAKAAKTLPPHIRIVNATPDSAIKCFPMMDLQCALFAGYGEAADSGKTLQRTEVIMLPS